MPLTNALDNYPLGRGEIWLAKLIPGSRDPDGFRYIGLTQGFSWNTASTTLDLYDMDHGQKELVEQAYLETTRSGTFSCNNINYDNLALLALGTLAEITQVATPVVAETVTINAQHGFNYQLGIQDPASTHWPAGIRDLTAVGAVTGPAATPVYTVVDDYTVNLDTGTIYVVPGGAITAGSTLLVGYTPTASSRAQIISGSTPIEVALKFIPYNQTGEQIDYFMTRCKITPDGDFALKGDTWQMINFKIGVLKPADRAAVYITGAPFIGP